VDHTDDLQVSVAAKCTAIAVVALAFYWYWYNFVCAVPRLAPGSLMDTTAVAPTEIATVGETGMVPLAETLAMVSTSIETRD